MDTKSNKVNNKVNLRDTLRTLDGEKAPHIEIRKDGKTLNYEDLTIMKVVDLEKCDISIFGSILRFSEGEETAKHQAWRKENGLPLYFNAFWDCFGGTYIFNIKEDKPAIEALQDIYVLPQAIMNS